jgi:hypothetical protein
MANYRLLYFLGGQLDHWEMIEAIDHMGALEEAAGRPSQGLMELWSERGKVASFKPVGTHSSNHTAMFGGAVRPAPEPGPRRTGSSDAPARSSKAGRGRG